MSEHVPFQCTVTAFCVATSLEGSLNKWEHNSFFIGHIILTLFLRLLKTDIFTYVQVHNCVNSLGVAEN
jgi:putative effector of murein hydrolase